MRVPLLDLLLPRHIVDPELGALRRSWGLWRGTIRLDATGAVPLSIAGSRKAPEPAALALARSAPAAYPTWRALIEPDLLVHFSGYEDSEDDATTADDAPIDPWPRTRIAYVHAGPLDGSLIVEIGYRVEWDEEHTLGARIRDGRLLELNGSVLRP